MQINLPAFTLIVSVYFKARFPTTLRSRLVQVGTKYLNLTGSFSLLITTQSKVSLTSGIWDDNCTKKGRLLGTASITWWPVGTQVSIG